MEEGTIIAARILDGYYFYRVPANADGCTFYGTSGRDFMLFGVLPDSNNFIIVLDKRHLLLKHVSLAFLGGTHLPPKGLVAF